MLKEQFPNRLRLRRHEKGLSQENMAAMLKMALNTYSNIERGKTEPNLTKLEQIAEVLEIEVGALLGIGNNNYFNQSGSHYVGGDNIGPVTFQFDKVILEGLLSKMSQYEKEIAELKARLENL